MPFSSHSTNDSNQNNDTANVSNDNKPLPDSTNISPPSNTTNTVQNNPNTMTSRPPLSYTHTFKNKLSSLGNPLASPSTAALKKPLEGAIMTSEKSATPESKNNPLASPSTATPKKPLAGKMILSEKPATPENKGKNHKTFSNNVNLKKSIDELPINNPSELSQVESDSAFLEINLDWNGNTAYFRNQIIAWHQSKQKDKIFEIIHLLNELLEKPAQYLYRADSFTKQSHTLKTDKSSETLKRHYSYYDILSRINHVFQSCREPCKTRALFQTEHKVAHVKSKTMEEAFTLRDASFFANKEEKKLVLHAFLQNLLKEESLQNDLVQAKANFLDSLTEQQKEDPLITNSIDMEAARIVLLQQAARDLLEIYNRLQICPDINSLSQIRYITIVNKPTTLSSNPGLYGFMDLLALLSQAKMPKLTSIVIEDRVIDKRLDLCNLLTILTAKNQSHKLQIMRDLPKEERVIFNLYSSHLAENLPSSQSQKEMESPIQKPEQQPMQTSHEAEEAFPPRLTHFRSKRKSRSAQECSVLKPVTFK